MSASSFFFFVLFAFGSTGIKDSGSLLFALDVLLVLGTAITSLSSDFALDFALAGGLNCGTPVSSSLLLALDALLLLGTGTASCDVALDVALAGGRTCGTTDSGSVLFFFGFRLGFCSGTNSISFYSTGFIFAFDCDSAHCISASRSSCLCSSVAGPMLALSRS